MLVDSGLKKGCYHSSNWVMAGKAKSNGGGVKWASRPASEWRMKGLPLRHEMLHTYQEEPKPAMEGWLYAL